MATSEETATDDNKTRDSLGAEGDAPDRGPTSETPEDDRARPAPATVGTGGFAAILLGGFLAGAIGYLVAYYTEFGLFEVAEDDSATAALDEISGQIGTQADRIAALETSLEEAARAAEADAAQREADSTAAIEPVPETPDYTDAIAAIESALGGVGGELEDLADRVAGLETTATLSTGTDAPATEGGDTQAADALRAQIDELAGSLSTLNARIDSLPEPADYDDEIAEIEDRIAALDTRVSEQSDAISQARADAKAETARIATQGALAEINAALGTGEPYASAVSSLDAASDAGLPDGLTAPADAGVATLRELQAAFPDAARDALPAAIGATAGDGAIDRFGAFLRAQTNARSTSEREGDGPDAILSRAEARVNDGDLAAALDEIDALPPEGQEAMSDWVDRARTRLDAVSAFESLSQSLNTN